MIEKTEKTTHKKQTIRLLDTEKNVKDQKFSLQFCNQNSDIWKLIARVAQYNSFDVATDKRRPDYPVLVRQIPSRFIKLSTVSPRSLDLVCILYSNNTIQKGVETSGQTVHGL